MLGEGRTKDGLTRTEKRHHPYTFAKSLPNLPRRGDSQVERACGGPIDTRYFCCYPTDVGAIMAGCGGTTAIGVSRLFAKGESCVVKTYLCSLRSIDLPTIGGVPAARTVRTYRDTLRMPLKIYFYQEAVGERRIVASRQALCEPDCLAAFLISGQGAL